MGEFFKGWRRKVGVITLLFACMFAAGWARSVVVKDEISIRKSISITNHFISNRSRFAWKIVTIDDPSSTNFVITFYFSKPAQESDFYRGSNESWHWRCQYCGFEFGRFTPNGPPWVEDVWIVPYWSIVIPLTVISAYLLLSRPRQSTPMKINKPTANEGA